MALVRDLMHRGVITCHLETSIRDVAQIMEEHDIRCVIVTDDRGEVWGIISILSIFKAWGKNLDEVTAEDILLPHTITVSPNSTMDEAVQIARRNRIEHLVIVSPGTRRAVGVLTTFDVIQHMAGIAVGSFRRGVTELGELRGTS